MVSKSGFIPNVRRPYPPKAAKIFKQDSLLSGPNSLNVMFNASQIPDNPGYMDFNNPTPPIPAPNQINAKMNNTGRPQRNVVPRNPIDGHHNWVPRHGRGAQMRPNGPKFNGGNRHFNGMDMPQRQMPPVPPMPMPMRGPMPHIPIDSMPNHFNSPPGPMIYNNMVGIRPGRPMPPIPPPILRKNRNAVQMRRPNGIAPGRVIKNRRNGKPMRPTNPIKSEIPTKKTLKEIINQYPLDKPWVTEEIRQEHAKKEDIENRLKGNKNDELFAAFKVQRDKFVSLYESARDKHLDKGKSKDNEKNMTEPDKSTAENKNIQK